jgi:hypothetical protein
MLWAIPAFPLIQLQNRSEMPLWALAPRVSRPSQDLWLTYDLVRKGTVTRSRKGQIRVTKTVGGGGQTKTRNPPDVYVVKID